MRMTSLALALAVLMSASQSAFAAAGSYRTDYAPEVIPDHCAGKTGKDRGRCISDTLKDLARQQKAFAEKQRTEREAWLQEHASMGITEEYTKLKQAFIKTQTDARKAFEAEQLVVRKKLHEESAAFRKNAGAASSSSSSRKASTVTGEQAEEAKAKCAKVTDERAKRLCLKSSLKILAPESKPFYNRR